MKRDFLSIADWSRDDLQHILDLSARVKEYPANFAETLRGRSIALIFEKQSLRTHVTFEVGVHELGAHPVYLTQADISLGKRESIHDTARNLERWVHGVVVRTYAHETCVELAAGMRVPVVNALTDYEHPCQAVGDFLTVHERLGPFRGKRMVFVGDGNNVCHSLMLMAAKLGMDFVAATPRGYAPDINVFKAATAAAKESGSSVDISHHARDAVKSADVVYTDVWVSMGQEAQHDERVEAFKEFRVDTKLMSEARRKALFMHCLPAHRGMEVTDAVIDSPQSAVFDQAENRLHSAKAILLALLHGD